MTLLDSTKVIVNNDPCLVLKVKPFQSLHLIALGCFKGNETMFRITKGKNKIFTIWYSDGSVFEFDENSNITLKNILLDAVQHLNINVDY